MDNAQKAIMIGVGLFITILIIAAVMLIVNPAIGLIDSAAGKIGNLDETFTNMLYSKYDDRVVTGAEVISFVQQYAADENMIIEVKPNSSSNMLQLGKARGNESLSIDKGLKYDDSNKQTKVSALTDSSNPETYVPSSARYEAKLIKSTSGDTIVGVQFVRTNR